MRTRRYLAATDVVAVLLVGVAATAFAQTLVPCSGPALQNAVANANTAGGGTLNLTPGCTYSLTTPDNAQTGLTTITTPLRINGNGATITRSPAAADFRFFTVGESGDLTLHTLTLSNGRAHPGRAISIESGGTLTLSATTVTGNTARQWLLSVPP